VFTVSQSPNGVAFWIHVTPRSRRERVGGTHGDALRVRVGAPPVEGAANAACVKALARALRVRSGAVEIDPGSRSRRKRVDVAGDARALASRLEELAAEAPAQ
jgi:uncharacterized protein (TIGR00251 family)